MVYVGDMVGVVGTVCGLKEPRLTLYPRDIQIPVIQVNPGRFLRARRNSS
jgi:hypothetical protein